MAGIPSGGQLEDDEQLEELEQRRTMIDQIRQILRSQLDTLVWVDKQSGKININFYKLLQKNKSILIPLPKNKNG